MDLSLFTDLQCIHYNIIGIFRQLQIYVIKVIEVKTLS